MHRDFAEKSFHEMDTRFSLVTTSIQNDEPKADANCKESSLSFFGIETISKQAI